jgi:hypothetical protein
MYCALDFNVCDSCVDYVWILVWVVNQDYVFLILMCGDYVSAMKSIYVNLVLFISITVTVK